MAKIGLKYPVYAKATESESAITYSLPGVVGKAITANVSIETNDVKLYADDIIAESDHSFTGGAITLNVDDLSNAAQLALLGHREGDVVDVATGAKELLASGGAIPAFVGFGFYAKKVVNNVPFWRAIWLKKVQFAEPTDDFKTKGEQTEFNTPTMEGTIMADVTGDWKTEGTFSTEAGARNYIMGKAGLLDKASAVTSNVASGSYAAAQNVTLTTTEPSGVIYYTTDGTIPSATNGTLYSTAITCAKPSNKCIKAVTTKAGKTRSDILELYITVTA